MNINDPQVSILLEKIKPGPKNYSISRTKKNIVKIYKLESVSFEKCSHKIPYAECIICQAIDHNATTDHQIARYLYPRFAKPIRVGPSYGDDNTQENTKRSRLEILKNWPGILMKKKATLYDTMLFYSDYMIDEMPTNKYFRIWLWLASHFYDVKKITGFSVPRLTKDETYDIERMQIHIFTCQINKIKDAFKYESWYR